MSWSSRQLCNLRADSGLKIASQWIRGMQILNLFFIKFFLFSFLRKTKIKGEGLSLKLVLFLVSILKNTQFSWHKEYVLQSRKRAAVLKF